MKIKKKIGDLFKGALSTGENLENAIPVASAPSIAGNNNTVVHIVHNRGAGSGCNDASSTNDRQAGVVISIVIQVKAGKKGGRRKRRG